MASKLKLDPFGTTRPWLAVLDGNQKSAAVHPESGDPFGNGRGKSLRRFMPRTTQCLGGPLVMLLRFFCRLFKRDAIARALEAGSFFSPHVELRGKFLRGYAVLARELVDGSESTVDFIKALRIEVDSLRIVRNCVGGLAELNRRALQELERGRQTGIDGGERPQT